MALDYIFPNLVWQDKFNWLFAETILDWAKILLLKPQTFMNKSWISVKAAMGFYKLEPSDLLVLHDEIDLPTAKIQLKVWGNPAWHNWLKSIIERLGTQDFTKIRIWIDRPIDRKLVSDWVLGVFKADEKKLIEDKYSEISDIIGKWRVNN